MRIILSVMLLWTVTSAAAAQSVVANGQIGYLQEWELKGRLAKTTTRSGADYSGRVALRHVGLCSANGVEEKTAVVQLRISPSRLEGTLAMDHDTCRIVAMASSSYAGVMSCRNGKKVPMSLSIGEAPVGALDGDESPIWP